MANPMADYGRRERARKAAAVRGVSGLVGSGLSLIPGVGPIVGGAVSGLGGIIAGAGEGDSEAMSQSASEVLELSEKGKRDKKLDAILAAMKAMKTKPEEEVFSEEWNMEEEVEPTHHTRRTRTPVDILEEEEVVEEGVGSLVS